MNVTFENSKMNGGLILFQSALRCQPAGEDRSVMEMLEGPTYCKETKPSPAPPRCHHMPRTRPTGGQMVQRWHNCFHHDTNTN